MDVVWKGIAGDLVTVCYFAVDRVDYRIALLGGPAAWLIVALGVFLAPRWT